MSLKDNLRYETVTPALFQSLLGVHEAIQSAPLDRILHHLCILRASQINRCAFCIDMHVREAREDGESQTRLDQLVAWQDTTAFSEKERAALSWTEALTYNDGRADLSILWKDLEKYFSEEEICVLTIDVGMINLWNRINVARHSARAEIT